MSEFEDKRFDDALREKLSQHRSPMPGNLWDEISERVDADGASDQVRWQKWGWTGVIFLLIATGVALEYNKSISPIQVFFPTQEQIQHVSEQTESRADPQSSDELVTVEGAFIVSEETIPALSKSPVQSSAISRTGTSLLGASIKEEIASPSQASLAMSEDASLAAIAIEEDIIMSDEASNLQSVFAAEKNVKQEPMEAIENFRADETTISVEHGASGTFGEPHEVDEPVDIMISVVSSESVSSGKELETSSGGPIEEGKAIDTSSYGGMSEPGQEAVEQFLVSSLSKKWSLDILLGPSVNYRTFTSESSPELQSHRNDHDRMLLSTSYAVMLRRTVSDRMGISTGLFWLNTGERYEYTVNSATHAFTNHYNYLSVPLEVDYLLWSKGDFDLNAGAGVQYNFLKEGSSSWVDLGSLQPVTHSNKGPESPFSEQAWALNAELGIRYAFNDRLDILLQERSTFFQESLYKEETGLDQRPYSFNTMLGIGIKF